METIQLTEKKSVDMCQDNLIDANKIANAIAADATHDALRYDAGFVTDEDNIKIFKALCLYFANDLRFEKEGFGKLNKGIILAGDIGTGKTLLMNAFSNNPRAWFKVISTNTVNDDYQRSGIDGLYDYFTKCRTDGKSYGYDIGMCFDDLGAENTNVKHMGTDCSPMEKVILIRYEKRFPFYLTHFTTNLTPDQVEDKYGSRVRSRLREMCNVLELTGKDRRK